MKYRANTRLEFDIKAVVNVAERRMFTKKITESDAFLDMPLSTQCLYFHLNMSADDDGFVNNPKRIQRLVGASDDDMKLLIAKSFIILFESGIIVIKHWKMHNYIQTDRYKPSDYIDEKSMLYLKKNKSYTLNSEEMDTECIQNVSVGKVRLGKDRLGKDIYKEKTNKKESQSEMLVRLSDDRLSFKQLESLSNWITYKKQRKDKPYVEQGMKALITKTIKTCEQYGEDAFEYAVNESMSSNYQGIVWDFADRYAKKTNVQHKKQSTNDSQLDKQLENVLNYVPDGGYLSLEEIDHMLGKGNTNG